MSENTAAEASVRSFDAARFVSYYLQALAWFSIGMQTAQSAILGGVHVDFSFVFLFWASSAVKRRSETARKLVVWVSGLLLGAAAFFAVIGVFFGTQHMTVKLIREIENPKVWQLLLMSGAFVGVAGVPFFVLVSSFARAQFGREYNRDIPKRSAVRREPELRGE